MPRGIDRTEHLGEEIRIRQIRLCDRCHWEVKIQIDNAVRLNVRIKDLRTFEIANFERQMLRLGADVGACEDWNRRECLLRIRLLLRRLECRAGIHHLRNLIGAHRRLFLSEDRRLCRLTLLPECTAWHERHESLMRILDEGFPNHLLEVALFQTILQLRKHILIAQIIGRCAIVEPRLHHADTVDQPLRRGAKVRLAQAELKRIERCLHERVIELTICKFPQGLIDDADELIRT